MKKKRFIILSAILIGVLMLCSFGKVQAVSSIFTETELTRKNLEQFTLANNLSATNKVLGISKNRESGNAYTWNVTTTDAGKTVWKIAEYDTTSSSVPNYEKLYYCLNAERGFGFSNGSMAESSKSEYNTALDMKNMENANLVQMGKYIGGDFYATGTYPDAKREKINKVLWILDHLYTYTGLENYQTSSAYKELMSNADIPIDGDSNLNLTEDDIDVVQQMAIWHITNPSYLSNTSLPSLYINGEQLSSKYFYTDKYGTQITGAKRQEKAEKLYIYFIDNASETYVSKVPSLAMNNSIAKVEDLNDSYLVGPYTLGSVNADLITKITATVTPSEYTLLNGSKNEVSNNDFSKVINNNFYLKIPKSAMKTGNNNISLKIDYTYKTRNLSLLTNATTYSDTQPVVVVEEKNPINTISTNININLIDISVIKKWDDADNKDGVRPTSIKVQLYEDGVVKGNSIELNKSNNWKYTWSKLLAGKTYEVRELNNNNLKIGDNGKLDENYVATYNITGNITTITNKHIPEVISKTVTKIWEDNDNQDGVRPNSVTVTLFKKVDITKQKIESIELNKQNNWKYTWNNLPKYENGKEITYVVEENVPNNYKETHSEDTFTITNTYTPNVISKSIIKEWDDQDNVDGIRPDEVTVQLYADGEAYGDPVILKKSNAFRYTWESLPEKKDGKAINYTISEIKIGNEEVLDGKASKYEVSYRIEGNVIIATNKHVPETTSKKVIKVWNDNNKDSARPSTIKIQLYANGKAYGDPITLTAGEDKVWQENELTYTWEKLPLKEDGKEITYTVKELDENGNPIENEGKYNNKYVTTYSEDTFTITNTYKEFDLALRKFITEVDEEKYSREPKVDTSTIATTGTAIYKHTKQPVAVQKGNVVTYTIRVYNEGEIDGYVNEITDHLPNNLIPIISGVDGIDKEKYKKEIKFNSDWLWEVTDNGNTIKTKITSKDTATNLPNIDKEEAKQNEARLLKAFKNGEELDYVDVQIKCLVSDNVINNEYITNIAEITDAENINGVKGDGNDSTLGNVDYSNLLDYKNEEALASNETTYIPGQEDDDDFEKLIIKEFDLALRKFITKVNDTSYSREPVVDTSKLGTKDENGKVITTAKYIHSKEPVIVSTGDIVTYTIRIFNEGTLDGNATEIADDMPKGLEFLPDSSVNVEYKWKMIDKDGNETTDLSKANTLITDYLSGENNIIKAVTEKEGIKTLDYKDVQIQFKVTAKAEKLKDNIIKNVAQISADSDKDIDSIPNRNEKYNYDGENEDDIDYEPIKLQYFDLALRKFITKVNETDYNNRYPEIVYGDDGSITYKHTKDPVLVATTDTVIYTIRVYNEGEKPGYATEIKDDLPEGLEFLPENEINKKYKWSLIDKDGKETQDVKSAVKVTTDYLKDELLDALVVKEGQKVLSYKDVQIAFKVIEPTTSKRIVVNTAEISKDSDDDIDSTPDNNVITEDDIDKEYIKVQYFDLALKKWVTETRVTYNGKTTTTPTGFNEDTQAVAKVDLVSKKLSKTTVKFVYNIKVINEGEIAGYAYEVKDYIPKGLKFVAEDNKNWKEIKEGVVVTDQLKDKLLQPGESATVEIVLTWKNSSTNMGLKTNYAEISEDSGDDIDSTPDNYKLDEDDIDYAQVILSIKTSGTKTYALLVLISITVLAGGIFLIKKYVIK